MNPDLGSLEDVDCKEITQVVIEQTAHEAACALMCNECLNQLLSYQVHSPIAMQSAAKANNSQQQKQQQQ